MRPLAIFSVFALLLVGCTSSRAQVPKVYSYEYSCDISWKPSRIVTYRSVGHADTTLILLSGHIVNYLGTYGTDVFVAKNAKSGEIIGRAVGKQGEFALYAPAGQYSVQVLSLDYAPFLIENVNLVSGQQYQLEVYLQQRASSTTMCVYESKHKLSARQQRGLGSKLNKSATRLYPGQVKEDASVKLNN